MLCPAAVVVGHAAAAAQDFCGRVCSQSGAGPRPCSARSSPGRSLSREPHRSGWQLPTCGWQEEHSRCASSRHIHKSIFGFDMPLAIRDENSESSRVLRMRFLSTSDNPPNSKQICRPANCCVVQPLRYARTCGAQATEGPAPGLSRMAALAWWLPSVSFLICSKRSYRVGKSPFSANLR